MDDPLDLESWGIAPEMAEAEDQFSAMTFGRGGTSEAVQARLRRMLRNVHKNQEARIEREIANAQKPKVTTYSTQYAVDHGKKLGWQVRDRERYDARTKRHHDLMLGVDILFYVKGRGLVGVQAAGVGERAKHYKRFEDAGGIEVANDMRIEVLYWVFERGEKEPLEEEKWA